MFSFDNRERRKEKKIKRAAGFNTTELIHQIGDCVSAFGRFIEEDFFPSFSPQLISSFFLQKQGEPHHSVTGVLIITTLGGRGCDDVNMKGRKTFLINKY